METYMKKQKIVITGGLGYIGTELAHLYSGESRYKDIIVIDNRFISERVSQLRSWGIEFIQGEIIDREFMKSILKEADIVYHLAGITSVAYTASEGNAVQDELIREVGIAGTWNVIKSIPNTCKLIFPSTHVVFEGYQEPHFDITENTYPCPILTYAKGKVESEKDIIAEVPNHIIVRLGSVYGYSTDTMRIGIMPNLFSKIASQDGTISLAQGGLQHKSLVHVIDVVRAMKFLAEGEYKGLYHLSNENTTVRAVAELCKEVNPKVQLVGSDAEVPNKGYTLSNAKLLSTGFKFLYNLQDAIRDMITRWSSKEQPTDLEYTQKGGKEFNDHRGTIRNYELTEPINLIGWIETRAGNIRANHYHPIQEQKCLLIGGYYVSVTQDLSYENAPLEYRLISPGDVAVIQPNVAHAMVFLKDALFLNLVNGEREHENYGITHTISHPIVDEFIRLDIMNNYRTTCRSCSNENLLPALSLGMSPLANNLINIGESAEQYPLELMFCPHCYNCQLSYVVPAAKMFDNYLYVSSTSKVFREHFEKAADQYIEQFQLNDQSLVLDIGSNDGVFLKPLIDKGIRAVGIEPATNVALIANSNQLPTINGYFNEETAKAAYTEYGSPDIITAFNVFAHADDLDGITRNVFSLLKENGTFIIEVQYFMDTMRDLTFDNIYHEHTNYWTVSSLCNFFNVRGLHVTHVEHIDTHGGSIRCYIKRLNTADSTVEEFIKEEMANGVADYGTYKLFGQRVHELKVTVQRNMKLLKEQFPVICAYGSPAKATTALNYFGITASDIQYTIEDNDMKVGKLIPGVNIPIYSKRTAPGHKAPDLCIVLAWNFFDSIVAQNPHVTNFISIKDLEIPDMPILDTQVWSLKGQPAVGKVYDTFIFFNELDLLEMRLNVLDPVVDYFVVVEANITHSGEPKGFVLEEHLHEERFYKFLPKLIYIKVEDMPKEFTNLGLYHTPVDYSQECWNRIMSDILSSTLFSTDEPLRAREHFQRASIIRGLGGCHYEDIIMLSDIDEIPNPDTLKGILSNFDDTRIYSLRQNSYYYYLNTLKETHWVGPRVATFKRFMEQPIGKFRHIRDIIVANGGWHFSFQGDVATKLQAYSHADMATEDVMSKLPQRIQQLQDPFGRGGALKKVTIDNTYPQYLRDNIDHYSHMIL